MANVVEKLPESVRAVFVDVIGERDPRLLSELRAQESPNRTQRISVEGILADEFARNLGADSEPSERGEKIDDAIGTFLSQWPIHPEDGT